MTDEKMLAAYEALVTLTTVMLAAVETRDWDQFVAQEAAQEALIGVLQSQDTEPTSEPATIAKKRTLLEQVLANQTKITALIIPWRSDIGTLLQSSGAARRLSETYRDTPLAR